MQSQNEKIFLFIISVAFWWMMLGSVELSLGFLALILIHEMGHYIFAKHIGVKVAPPVMTPLGGAVQMLTPPRSADEEAFVAFGGPIFGTIAGIATLALSVLFSLHSLESLSFLCLLLQLFNLIPLSPLDGGRISMAIDRRMWVLGLPMIAYAIFAIGFNWFNALMGILIVMSARRDIAQRKLEAQSNPGYFELSPGKRTGYILGYLALGAFLLFAVLYMPVLKSLLIGLGI